VPLSASPTVGDSLHLSKRDGPELVQELRRIQDALASSLPAYALPTIWIVLQSLPLTISGKTDRQRVAHWLATIDQATLKQSQSLFVAHLEGSGQLSDKERAIWDIIHPALNIDSDCCWNDQSFYGIGGDSIAAMRIAALARRNGFGISVRDLLVSRGLSELARRATAYPARAQPTTTSLALSEACSEPDITPRKFPLLDMNPATIESFCTRRIYPLGISQEGIVDMYPCTSLQQGMLISQGRNPGLYWVVSLWELDMATDLQKFQLAWASVAARHPMLRTIFLESMSSDPARLYEQVVLSSVDTQPLLVECNPSDFERIVQQEKHDVLVSQNDPLGRPLHRLTMYVCSDGRKLCEWRFSHTILDGASLAVLLRDVEMAYRYPDTPLPKAPSFASFIEYHRHIAPSIQSSLQHWRACLADAEPCMFPSLTRVSSGSTATLKMAYVDFHADAESEDFAQRIRRFCRENEITIANVFQTVWALVLRLFVHTSRATMGITTSGRDIPIDDVSEMVGPMVNILISSSKVSHKQTMLDLAVEMKNDFVRNLDHQHISLAAIQRGIGLGSRRLFNTTVSCQKMEDRASTLLRPLGGQDPTEFDICVNVLDTKQDIQVSFNYWSSILSVAQAEELSKIIRKITKLLVFAPTTEIGSLTVDAGQVPLTQSAMKPSILAGYLDSTRTHPQCIAVRAWDHQWSYSELSSNVEKLTALLSRLISQRNSSILLAVDPSAYGLVALIAAMQSAHAITLLDRQDMSQSVSPNLKHLTDGPVAIVLTTQSLQQAVAELNLPYQVVVVDELLLGDEQADGDYFESRASIVRLRNNWILFSRGHEHKVPNLVSYATLAHDAEAQALAMAIDTNAHLLHTRKWSETQGLAEVFAVLSHGACLYISTATDRSDEDVTSSLFKNATITHAELAQSQVQQLKPRDLRCVRVLSIRISDREDLALDKLAELIPLILSYTPDVIPRWKILVNQGQTSIPSDSSHDPDEECISDLEGRLQRIWCQVLNLPSTVVGLKTNFASLGGDSISVMQVVSLCRQQNINISTPDVFRARTIADLAKTAKDVEPSSLALRASSQATSLANFELSPIQSMFFDLEMTQPHRFNQSFLLCVNRPITVEALTESIEGLVSKHGMLRARFVRTDGAWMQHVSTNVGQSYRLVHHAHSNPDEYAVAVASLQRTLDFERGPLIGVALGNLGSRQYLFMTIHHLVVDLVSWRILLADLEGRLSGAPSHFPTRALAFQEWNKLQLAQVSHLRPGDVLQQPIAAPNLSYWGMERRPNLAKDEVYIRFDVDQVTTARLFGPCNIAFRTEPVELLLCTAIWAFKDTFPDRLPLAVFNESHGREPWNDDVDPSETCGWFTTLAPINPELTGDESLFKTLIRVKDARRRLSKNGWTYFTARYHSADCKEAFSSHAAGELLFNYLGRYQQLERANSLFTRTDPGELFDTKYHEAVADGDIGTPRLAMFEANALVENGSLKVGLTYNSQMKHTKQIHTWVSAWKKALLVLGTELCNATPTLTISDFPLLETDYERLHQFVKQTMPQLHLTSLEEIEDIYPCSPMQRDLILSQIKNPGLYNVQSTWKITEGRKSVDPLSLQEAWRLVCMRHPILRTVFIAGLSADFEMTQLVLRTTEPQFNSIRCDSETLPNILARRYPVPFADTQSPNQLILVQTNLGENYVTLAINHALVDGTSASIFMRDLKHAYEGRLGPTPPPYRDFVSYLDRKRGLSSLEYWTKHLAHVEPCIFPALKHDAICEPTVQSLSIELPGSDLLQEFVAEHSVTLSSLFQAAWAVVLKAYTGMSEVCFGYLTSGRGIDLPRANEIAGPMISMLVCRAIPGIHEDNTSFVRTVHDDFVSGIEHQHASLAEIYHALGFTQTALMNTVISVQRTSSSDDSNNIDSLNLNSYNAYEPTEFDITLNILVENGTISLVLTYWTTILSSELASSVADSMSAAVSGMLVKPNSSPRSISLLAQNSPRSPDLPCVENTIHSLIQEWVQKSPEAPSVCGHDGALTYRELDIESAKLSGRLSDGVIKPREIVLIVFEKSVASVIAILSVLRAGAAVCLFDPTQPLERLRQISEATRARVIVCSPTTESMCLNLVDTVFTFDQCEAVESSVDTPKFTTKTVSVIDPAYVIFTSGTTGMPKGSVVEHRAFCTSAVEHGKAIGITHDSRVLQFASFTFDGSILEILTTLILGGCICIPNEFDRLHNTALSIRCFDVNFALLTPSFARLLQPSEVPTLRTLVLGGEAMTKQDVARWHAHVDLHNAYGPSECAVIASVNRDVSNVKDANNIGKSVGGINRVVSPDSVGNEVPFGAVGELLILGNTLARCYLNNNTETERAFFQSRLLGFDFRAYRTGDLVRRMPDGSMEYVGRKDSQVKINGQRVSKFPEPDAYLWIC
jgi:amino acid adenylation domain-containing protein/non-ribosomal peptide synthase protein (TIGR01720 family)